MGWSVRCKLLLKHLKLWKHVQMNISNQIKRILFNCTFVYGTSTTQGRVHFFNDNIKIMSGKLCIYKDVVHSVVNFKNIHNHKLEFPFTSSFLSIFEFNEGIDRKCLPVYCQLWIHLAFVTGSLWTLNSLLIFASEICKWKCSKLHVFVN